MQTILAAIIANLELFLAGCVIVVFLISRLKQMDEVIYAAASLVAFVAFIGYVVVKVPAIDLTIVIIIVSVMIAVDFLLGIRESMKGNGSGSES